MLFGCSYTYGILPLEIETGRYLGIKQDERLCKMCDLGEVEDEIHFLVGCSLYNKERYELLEMLRVCYSNIYNVSDLVKLKILMTFEPRKLAKYIQKLISIRQSKLYV